MKIEREAGGLLEELSSQCSWGCPLCYHWRWSIKWGSCPQLEIPSWWTVVVPL